MERRRAIYDGSMFSTAGSAVADSTCVANREDQMVSKEQNTTTINFIDL